MVDANVLISGFIVKKSLISNMLKHIRHNHTLVVCQYVLDEVEAFYSNESLDLLIDIRFYLGGIKMEVVDYIITDSSKYPPIRDPKDVPVLINAIEYKVDIFITGDKDFFDVQIKNPRIMKPRQYMDEFMSGS